MYPDYEDLQGMGSPSTPAATVLVVEDEVLIRLALTDYLRSCGFRVYEASSGLDARAVFDAGADIQVVISDLHMPSPGDGLVLAQWIGEHYPDTKVILTSGVNASLEAAKTACSSVSALVPKPYQYEVVLGHIQTALAARASN